LRKSKEKRGIGQLYGESAGSQALGLGNVADPLALALSGVAWLAGRAWASLLRINQSRSTATREGVYLLIQAAIALVSAAVQPALLAPNLSLPHSELGLGLAADQLAIAASLTTGIADWLGALLLCTLLPVAALLFSPMDVLSSCSGSVSP
jgi:hypothetical protein